MAQNESVTSKLEEQYFDPSHEASFSGARNLIRLNKKKITPEQINRWLQKHDTYTLHKPIRKKFPRLHYNVFHIDQVWEMDLQDLRSLKNYNDGHCYILLVIDVFSKYLFLEALKTKTTSEVTTAFKKILERSTPRFPYSVQSDRGKEFVGKTFV